MKGHFQTKCKDKARTLTNTLDSNQTSKTHEILVEGISILEPKIQTPKDNLDNRYTKIKKEVTTNDLHKEIKDTKYEVSTLRKKLTILKIDQNLPDQRINQIKHTS